MATTVRQRLALPDFMGFGWLDRQSIREDDDLLRADYVNGEDLVYRVIHDGPRWSVEQFLDLRPVDSATEPSLADAMVAIVARQLATIPEPPPDWTRLARRLGDRARCIPPRTAAPTIPWPTLFEASVVAILVPGATAPDLRPKSYDVQRDRPPRVTEFPTATAAAWVSRPSGPAELVPIATYRTPLINVERVVDALLGPNEDFVPPVAIHIQAGSTNG